MNYLELSEKQKKAIKKITNAKKTLEQSGLELMLIDNHLFLYKSIDNVQFETVNQLPNYSVLDFGSMRSFGM